MIIAANKNLAGKCSPCYRTHGYASYTSNYGRWLGLKEKKECEKAHMNIQPRHYLLAWDTSGLIARLAGVLLGDADRVVCSIFYNSNDHSSREGAIDESHKRDWKDTFAKCEKQFQFLWIETSLTCKLFFFLFGNKVLQIGWHSCRFPGTGEVKRSWSISC